LKRLGLPSGSKEGEIREAFAGLMLAPILEVSLADGVTNPNEFEAIETYVLILENDFELCSKERLETLGTTMGMLPFVQSEWSKREFQDARTLLGGILKRLPESDAHRVRNAIAKACLHVATSSGGIVRFHTVQKNERHVLHDIIESLNLDQCSEGLNLL